MFNMIGEDLPFRKHRNIKYKRKCERDIEITKS